MSKQNNVKTIDNVKTKNNIEIPLRRKKTNEKEPKGTESIDRIPNTVSPSLCSPKHTASKKDQWFPGNLYTVDICLPLYSDFPTPEYTNN
ncbi:hypothetical protein [Methanosarcina barkeri]|uniref:hypothetical protein n=1 Tax=Methanosarcina barkeri TaxID=2208 RepID=UPI00064FC3BB|nr:hypothetical protein [Methanosarcina barkeri]